MKNGMIAVLAAAMLAACSSPSQLNAPSPVLPASSAVSNPQVLTATQSGEPDTLGQRQLATTPQLLFVPKFGTNTAVFVYSETDPDLPIAKITKGITGPGAITVDRNMNLYIGNNNGTTHNVEKFVPPYTGAPTATYSSGLSGPTDLAVAPDGTLYVAEATGGSFFSGDIVEFPPGQTTPSMTLQVTFPFGITTDSVGNLYVSPGTTHDVEKFKPGSTTGTFLGLQGLLSPAGLAFDTAGNLVVVDEGVGMKPAVYTFAPHSTTAKSAITSGLLVPETVTVSSGGTHIFVGDSGSTTVPQSVADFTYPTGVRIRTIFRLGFDSAVSPKSRI